MSSQVRAPLQPLPAPPTLTEANLPSFLNWVVKISLSGVVTNHQVDVALRAAELLLRSKMGEAQNKDTQHTLVRDGVIDPPPNPS